ncbi:MAG: hypothetical protein KF735_16710 [Chelatococcus sp.]|jgi:hypothetical protein|uniref:hypothetical protein n=1 Tax=unclassified Chelatococcus TaxID=2638111 RepID=UPI001BCEF4B7|nr:MULTISPECIES: hypothetical protein [unclassified Chelatococcus]CAH1658437.1 conserved hypothetical protein [Hyphomicrobiales bacterium]MBS7742171.1 hypothetical protein [Chelatococcus sp. HY11]MBX3539287.1 hypothetical protein [Chelatococcus sp.]MBX3542711.1 hypothetical protein [Chelatococcus sp.]MCO5075073.1 hypothetical protein [Chelatococcus sp.]
MIRLSLRTLPLFAIIIGLAMALAAFMTISGVSTAYRDLIRSRMAMVAQDIANDINSALALGLRLPEQMTLPALLSRQATADPLTMSIDVSDVDGVVLFSSNPTRAGHPDGRTDDLKAFRFDQPLVNDFGAPVGNVAIRFDGAAVARGLATIRAAAVQDALPIGLAAVLAGSFGCFLVLRHLLARARAVVEIRNEGNPFARADAALEQLHQDNTAMEHLR